MPKENRGNNKGSGGPDDQHQRDRDGSYSPEWLQKSRDDVPQTCQPLSHNPVVEAIMTGQSPTNEQDGQSQSPSQVLETGYRKESPSPFRTTPNSAME